MISYKTLSRHVLGLLQEILKQDIERIKDNQNIKEEIKGKIEIILIALEPLEKELFNKFE